jgi:hypothetical protein
MVTAHARAVSAARKRLACLKGEAVFCPDWPCYTLKVEDNLVPGVCRRDFWCDLARGQGNELTASPTSPAKFCAAHSSSALAVNVFGPFRHAPHLLRLAGRDAYCSVQFERKCYTGLKGGSPNLDVLAESASSVVAIEAKFLEYLTPKKASFSHQYAKPMGTVAEPLWRHLYDSLLAEPHRFRYLDAAQLVKHYVGLQHSFAAPQRSISLVYLYWEPTNAAVEPACVAHRLEIIQLAEELAGASIGFESLSYAQLWQSWLDASLWAGTASHVEALRQRYAFDI